MISMGNKTDQDQIIETVIKHTDSIGILRRFVRSMVIMYVVLGLCFVGMLAWNLYLNDRVEKMENILANADAVTIVENGSAEVEKLGEVK